MNTRQRLIEIALFIGIAAIVFFLPNVIAALKYSYFSALLDIHTAAEIDVDSDRPISAFAIDQGILCSTTEQLNLYTVEGELAYQRQLFGQHPIVVAAAKTIVIADLAKGELALLDSTLEVIAKRRDIGQMVAVKVAGNGHVVCQMQRANQLLVFRDQFSDAKTIDIPLGQIIDYSISADQTQILVSVIAVENLQLKSYVLQFDMTGKPIATSDLDGDLVFANYMLDNQVIVTQSKIKSFNRESQKVAEIVNMEKIDQSTSHQKFIYTSYVETDQDGVSQPFLSIYSDDLSYQQTLKLVALPSMIRVNDKFIVCYAEGTIYVYDHSLRSLASIRTNRNISQLQWFDDSQLMAYDNQHITVYQLR